ncbi:MAG: hypothetical protein RLN62_03040 [Rickettsiales bacterium]
MSGSERSAGQKRPREEGSRKISFDREVKADDGTIYELGEVIGDGSVDALLTANKLELLIRKYSTKGQSIQDSGNLILERAAKVAKKQADLEAAREKYLKALRLEAEEGASNHGAESEGEGAAHAGVELRVTEAEGGILGTLADFADLYGGFADSQN